MSEFMYVVVTKNSTRIRSPSITPFIPSSSASSPSPHLGGRWRNESKWASIAAATWIQSTSGSTYCFGLYSPPLKSSQSYSQSTLDSVAFFKDLGANVGVFSGLLYSSGGSRSVLAAGRSSASRATSSCGCPSLASCRPRSCASTCSSARTRRRSSTPRMSSPPSRISPTPAAPSSASRRNFSDLVELYFFNYIGHLSMANQAISS